MVPHTEFYITDLIVNQKSVQFFFSGGRETLELHVLALGPSGSQLSNLKQITHVCIFQRIWKRLQQTW